jgi:hypothetical protein
LEEELERLVVGENMCLDKMLLQEDVGVVSGGSGLDGIEHLGDGGWRQG